MKFPFAVAVFILFYSPLVWAGELVNVSIVESIDEEAGLGSEYYQNLYKVSFEAPKEWVSSFCGNKVGRGKDCFLKSPGKKIFDYCPEKAGNCIQMEVTLRRSEPGVSESAEDTATFVASQILSPNYGCTEKSLDTKKHSNFEKLITSSCEFSRDPRPEVAGNAILRFFFIDNKKGAFPHFSFSEYDRRLNVQKYENGMDLRNKYSVPLKNWIYKDQIQNVVQSVRISPYKVGIKPKKK